MGLIEWLVHCLYQILPVDGFPEGEPRFRLVLDSIADRPLDSLIRLTLDGTLILNIVDNETQWKNILGV